MRKILLTLAFCGLTFIAKSQKQSVEESTYGIQTGILGVWGYNEAKLLDQVALRIELGLDSGIFGGTFYDGVGFLMTPVITLEPRWYYNLDKRVSKSKSIAGNSGNFVSLKIDYHPDWFVISNYSNLRVVNQISLIPSWGIKRNIGNHFTYEAGFGIGYRFNFAKSAGYSRNQGEAAANLHARVGYRF
ncbi:hypothetical protein [Zobellia nedashkovskayae]|uniref:hypothetical protein n=1 Tax=Zobellia nedashkovskayae TaxID=2779510 RepID=UPI00188BA98C|nr:hypothetical protein [Zobellia nedashkovskayae]